VSLHRSFVPLLAACLLLGGSAAWARPPQGGPPPPTMPRVPRPVDPLSDSVRRIERSTRGQVLSAERVPYDGRNINRIKILDERGRVRVYMDDPQTPTPSPEPPTRGDDD
jgi:hypothetical protein